MVRGLFSGPPYVAPSACGCRKHAKLAVIANLDFTVCQKMIRRRHRWLTLKHNSTLKVSLKDCKTLEFRFFVFASFVSAQKLWILGHFLSSFFTNVEYFVLVTALIETSPEKTVKLRWAVKLCTETEIKNFSDFFVQKSFVKFFHR